MRTPDCVEALLRQSAALHRHLCPRQVLGVRIGLYGGAALGLDVPRTDKRLLIFVETDGCGADGVSVATGCWVGRRTLRVLDYGKLAATFVDTHTGQAARVVPRPGVREAAWRYASMASSRWAAQLEGYQLMPEHELLLAQPVTLTLDLETLIGRPGLRMTCETCGEEIMNQRQVIYGEMVLCRACAGEAYYRLAPVSLCQSDTRQAERLPVPA
jgi:formylmethanofuran dehydrogenase subunit E